MFYTLVFQFIILHIALQSINFGNGVADGSLTQHTDQVDTDIDGEIQDILRVDIQLKSAASGT